MLVLSQDQTPMVRNKGTMTLFDEPWAYFSMYKDAWRLRHSSHLLTALMQDSSNTRSVNPAVISAFNCDTRSTVQLIDTVQLVPKFNITAINVDWLD